MFPLAFVIAGFQLVRARGFGIVLFCVPEGVPCGGGVPIAKFEGCYLQGHVFIVWEQSTPPIQDLQRPFGLSTLHHLCRNAVVNGGHQWLTGGGLVRLLPLHQLSGELVGLSGVVLNERCLEKNKSWSSGLRVILTYASHQLG